MRLRVARFALFFLALTALLSAQGVRAYEPFAYGVTGSSVGDLNGKGGGAGFAGSWVGPRQLPTVAAWWSLESDAKDAAAGNDGVLQGTLGAASFVADVPTAIAGWSTRSLRFDGQNDYIDLTPHLAKFKAANMGTISAWFKTSSTGALTIFSISDSNATSIETSVGVSRGRIYFSTRTDGYMSAGGTIRSASTYNDGAWHHVAWVVDRAQMARVYVDGVSVLAAPVFQALASNLPGADTMALGRNVDSNNGPQWYYEGLLDDVTIFGVPLSAADVAQLATTIPIAIQPANDTGGPDLLEQSLTSGAFTSRGLQPAGNRLMHRGTATRMLPTTIDLDADGEHYVSYLVRRTDRTAGVVTPMLLMFHTGVAHVGRVGWNTVGRFRAGAGTIRDSARMAASGTTYFVVLKWQTRAAGDDLLSCRVYEPSQTVHASDSLLSGEGLGLDEWDVEDLPFQGTGVVDRMLFDMVLDLSTVELDELRIGGSWDAVTRPAFGSGCFGAETQTVGIPQLGANYRLELLGAPPSAPGFLLIGLSRSTWGPLTLPFDLQALGAPGCAMEVSLDLLLPRTTDAVGEAALAITVPAAGIGVGDTVFGQWVIDGAGLPTGLVTSPGVQITVLR